MPFARTPFWEKAVPPSLALKPNNSVSLSVSLVPSSYFPCTGAQSKWFCQWVSLCAGALKEILGTPKALHLTQPKSLLDITARSYRDFSHWNWNRRLGSLIWGWDPSFNREDLTAKMCLLIFNSHTPVWDQRFCLPFFYQSCCSFFCMSSVIGIMFN